MSNHQFQAFHFREMFCSCLHWPGGSSSFSLQPVLHINDDWPHNPLATPLTSISAESCARAFISTWIMYWDPALLTSDRGAQFTSSFWARVCETLKIFHSTKTSFHPQPKGMIERFHRSLKSSLWARLAGQDWVQHLPLVLLGPQRRFWLHPCWGPFWYSVSCPWTILGCSRSAFDRFSPKDWLCHHWILQTCSSSHLSCSPKTSM